MSRQYWLETVNNIESECDRLQSNVMSLDQEAERLRDVARDLMQVLHVDDSDAVAKANYLRSSFDGSVSEVDDAINRAADSIRTLRQIVSFYV